MNYKLLLITLFSLFVCLNSNNAQTSLDPELKKQVTESLKANGNTIRFMENKGQIAKKEVLYYFAGKNGSVYIEKNKLVFVANYYKTVKHNFLEDENSLTGQHTFSINFNGANLNSKLNLGDHFRTKYNYFTDLDSTKWVSGVQASKDLTLEDIYKGIDLRLYSTEDGSLEFDWIVKPHADYNQIKLEFEGQDSLIIKPDGSLKIGLRENELQLHIPESYQLTDQGKVLNKLNFVQDGNAISFKPETAIDPFYPLIIDPTLLWGSFMDGNGLNGDGGGAAIFDQYLFAIQLDTLTSILYAAGACNLNIPTNAAPYDANGYRNIITGLNGGSNVNGWVSIVYRINSTGGDLVDLTLYGRTTISNSNPRNEGEAHSLSLSQNRVFIGGYTNDSIPITANAFDNTRNGNDSYLAVFNKALDTLVYATYLGSSGNEGENLGVNSIQALSDSTYVLGFTPAAALPTTTPNYLPDAAAYDITFGGVQDMYLCKFSNLNIMSWGTYIGGTSTETFNDLEVFPDGRITFAGWGAGVLPGEV
ncbi:MAG: hypothetical protein ABIO44_00925, partial [Saprospiraceae bacterium]